MGNSGFPVFPVILPSHRGTWVRNLKFSIVYVWHPACTCSRCEVATVVITDVETVADERQAKPVEISEDRISIWQLPKLVWAGAALFGINAVIGIGMLITPNLQTDIYGHEAVPTGKAKFAKPSPFTEVVDTRKQKVKLAEKLYPVVAEAPRVDENAAAMPDANLDLPRTSRVYQLDMPSRPQPTAYPQNKGDVSLQMPGGITYTPTRTDRPISTGSGNTSVLIN
jgi:hypothetical protein